MSTEYLNNKTFEILIVKFQTTKKQYNQFTLLKEEIISTVNRTSKRNKFKKPDDWQKVENDLVIINQEYKEVQGQLTSAFYTLSQNIVRYAKFNLIDHDDAIQEGVMICFEKIDRFDPSKGKAFNYMTTCILNHFRQLYRTARNYNELKRKYSEFMQIQLEQYLPANKKNSYKKQNNINFNMD